MRLRRYKNSFLTITGALVFALSVALSIPNTVLAQYVDRILRPCGGTSTGSVIVTTTNIDMVPCPGGSVRINGTPITPGGGLPDPGSNGIVVRTALNTDVARTITVSTPIVITNGNGVSANPLISCPTCVTSAAALTSTALMTGAGLQAAQTPSATATLSAAGNISTPGSVTTGNTGTASGNIAISGLTSGTVNLTVAAVAGSWTFTLPIDDGTPGQFLQTNGSGVTSWQTVGAGFTCGACALNTIQKGDGAGNLLNSRITDNGTTIDANSAAGVFQAGDTAFGTNGVNLLLDDANNKVLLQSDGNNLVQSLELNGTLQTATLLAGGSGGNPNVTLSLEGGATNRIQIAAGSFSPTAPGVADLGTAAAGYKQAFFDATITAGGTTGAQTINKSAGSVNFAAGATSLVVTSNKVTTSSIVICTVATNDTTLKSVQCVPAAGSFTMFASAAATAETRVQFWILNQ